jgi:Helix-turn-helix domain
LDPTPRQHAALVRHCGAARVAFNWGLARVKANLAQREAERSYGFAEAGVDAGGVVVDVLPAHSVEPGQR